MPDSSPRPGSRAPSAIAWIVLALGLGLTGFLYFAALRQADTPAETRVLQARPVDPLLRAWSAGVVEDKSFSQLTEEFARMVIPKVWEREGRKVSRVAARLSVSPKKVRRILGRVGRKRPKGD